MPFSKHHVQWDSVGSANTKLNAVTPRKANWSATPDDRTNSSRRPLARHQAMELAACGQEPFANTVANVCPAASTGSCALSARAYHPRNSSPSLSPMPPLCAAQGRANTTRHRHVHHHSHRPSLALLSSEPSAPTPSPLAKGLKLRGALADLRATSANRSSRGGASAAQTQDCQQHKLAAVRAAAKKPYKRRTPAKRCTRPPSQMQMSARRLSRLRRRAPKGASRWV